MLYSTQNSAQRHCAKLPRNNKTGGLELTLRRLRCFRNHAGAACSDREVEEARRAVSLSAHHRISHCHRIRHSRIRLCTFLHPQCRHSLLHHGLDMQYLGPLHIFVIDLYRAALKPSEIGPSAGVRWLSVSANVPFLSPNLQRIVEFPFASHRVQIRFPAVLAVRT